MICILISSCSCRISSHAFSAASRVETNMSPAIPSRFSSSIISLNSAHHASTPSYIGKAQLGVSDEGKRFFFWEIEEDTHLSVLFVSSVQHIGRRLEGKITDLVPLDDVRRGYVGLGLRGKWWGSLHT